MSSFPKDISNKIQHSLAEFSVAELNSGNRDLLGPDAQWLYEYAYRNAGQSSIPDRNDINPADMRQLLPDVMLLEPKMEAGLLADIHVRLTGSRIIRFYGPISGQSLRALSNPTATDRGFRCVDAVLASGQPVLGYSVRANADLPYVQVTLLFIPLLGVSGAIEQVLVHLTTELE